MKEEIQFTRDYRGMFNAAVEEEDTYRIRLLFKQLCDEAGVPNLAGDAAELAAGKEEAIRRNAIGKGNGPGRKV